MIDDLIKDEEDNTSSYNCKLFTIKTLWIIRYKIATHSSLLRNKKNLRWPSRRRRLSFFIMKFYEETKLDYTSKSFYFLLLNKRVNKTHKKDCILWFILNSYHVDTWYIERLKFIASLRCISRLPFCIGLIVYENVMKTSWSPNNIFPDDDNWKFKEINDFRVAIKSKRSISKYT